MALQIKGKTALVVQGRRREVGDLGKKKSCSQVEIPSRSWRGARKSSALSSQACSFDGSEWGVCYVMVMRCFNLLCIWKYIGAVQSCFSPALGSDEASELGER